MNNKKTVAFVLAAMMILSMISLFYIGGTAANENLALKQGSMLKLYSKDGNKYVSGMPFNTKASTLAVNFKGAVKITDDSGNTLSDTSILANGYKVTATPSGDTAYIIVQGDTDSNGKISVADYLRIKRQFMGTFTLTGVNLEAADVNGDGVITANDYLAIKVHFKKSELINASFTNANLKNDTTTTTGYELPFVPA